MNRIFRRGIFAISGLVLVSTLVFNGVSAQSGNQSGNGFRISPVRSDFTIEKGKSETLILTLENPADAPVTAQGIVNDFVASDKENGEPRLILDDTAPAPKNSFKNLAANIGEISLKAKEKKDIPVKIRVPENANPGGYYGAIRFVPTSLGLGQGNVGLTASVGTIVLVRVPGALTERIDLLGLSAGKNGQSQSIITSGDVSVITRLKNSGDIHLKPFGKVQIKNMFGKVVHEYEFNQAEIEANRANILPGSTRKFDDAVPKGKKLLGRYTISANLGYSQNGGLITAKASFWYVPVWALIVLLVLLISIAAGIYFIVHRLRPVQKRR